MRGSTPTPLACPPVSKLSEGRDSRTACERTPWLSPRGMSESSSLGSSEIVAGKCPPPQTKVRLRVDSFELQEPPGPATVPCKLLPTADAAGACAPLLVSHGPPPPPPPLARRVVAAERAPAASMESTAPAPPRRPHDTVPIPRPPLRRGASGAPLVRRPTSRQRRALGHRHRPHCRRPWPPTTRTRSNSLLPFSWTPSSRGRPLPGAMHHSLQSRPCAPPPRHGLVLPPQTDGAVGPRPPPTRPTRATRAHHFYAQTTRLLRALRRL